SCDRAVIEEAFVQLIVKLRPYLFIALAVGAVLPVVTAPMALGAGIVFGLLLGNPWKVQTSRWSRLLLQGAVMGLGFGVPIQNVIITGRDAFVYTAVSIGLTMLLGLALGRLFGTASRTSTLISFGTAICGGSAIAAMAPVIRAEPEETGVALATVFTLNALALLVFPPLGHLMGMGEGQFGLWSALAIHDTSSVVGAAAAFGGTALTIATTVKLTRMLWIMPVALGVALVTRSEGRVAFPYFILGFLAAAALRSLLPQYLPFWQAGLAVAKQALVVTLFLIGSGLTREVLAKTGLRPLLQATLLWVVVSLASAAAIMAGLVS
ncbi:MAG: putative sulfate exporter family transporter, partial [Geobacter sp.]